MGFLRVYIPDKNKDNALKIFKKKLSYEGLHDRIKNRRYFRNKSQIIAAKRVKKYAFIRHLKYVARQSL